MKWDRNNRSVAWKYNSCEIYVVKHGSSEDCVIEMWQYFGNIW